MTRNKCSQCESTNVAPYPVGSGWWRCYNCHRTWVPRVEDAKAEARKAEEEKAKLAVDTEAHNRQVQEMILKLQESLIEEKPAVGRVFRLEGDE